MSIHRKLTTVCCAAVLALGLAACSSSSDDDTSLTDTPTTTMTTPTTISPMEPTAAEQLANAQAAVDDAQTVVVALTAASSNSDRAAAYSSLAGAQSALAEASGIPENEIALLKTEIARLQGVIDQAAADAQTEADRIAAEMAAEADRIAALVAGTKTAETKEKAIGVEAGETGEDDAGLGGSVEVDAVTTYSMTVSHDGMAAKIVIADTANAADADPAKPQFAQAMDLGHGRTMHVRTMEADDDGDVVTEVVIVATDIEAPKAVAFAKFENAMGETPQALNARIDGVTVNEDEDNPADTRDLGDALAGDDDAAVLALVKSDAFKAGTAAVLDFAFEQADGDDAPGLQPVKAFETAGTYNGTMGTYRCNGEVLCMVTLDAKGAITAMTNGWIFTPATGATSDQPDYDYLHYGFWLKKTADADGAVTYNEVQTFAGATVGGNTEGSDGDELNVVQGSATYEGGATGVYVHETVNSDGTRESATAGQFSADAMLTANFGGSSVAVDDQNMVTGTIDNFALEHGEANTWAVNLKGTRAAGANEITSVGGATGGGAPGDWSGTFHGATPPTPAATDDDAFRVAPGSVVGEFNANFSNGSAVGGFGARKQ